MTHCQVSGSSSQLGAPSPPTPALLQMICTEPNVARVFSASAATCFPSDTSVTIPATSAPLDFSSATALDSACSSTSASTIFIPSVAKRSAIARPIPLAPPVTTATLPLNSFMFSSVVRVISACSDFQAALRVKIAAQVVPTWGHKSWRPRLMLFLRENIEGYVRIHLSEVAYKAGTGVLWSKRIFWVLGYRG